MTAKRMISGLVLKYLSCSDTPSAILDGTQPVQITLESLVRGTIPLDWDQKHRLFGLSH